MPETEAATWDPDVVAKFERARQLREDLAAKQAELREGISFEYEWVNNFDERTNPLAWQEWRLKNDPPQPDRAFAAILGDLVHNLRSTLDYCAWGAADEQARTSNPTQIYFPLYGKERDWNAWKKKRQSWYSVDTLAAFYEAQLFHAPADQLHPLGILQVLSNTDKHRLLNTARYGFLLHELELDPDPPVHNFDAVDLVPEAAGDVVARLEMPRPLDGGEVDVRVSFGWYECFRYAAPGEQPRWLAVNDMVDSMYRFTLDTVAIVQQPELLKASPVDV